MVQFADDPQKNYYTVKGGNGLVSSVSESEAENCVIVEFPEGLHGQGFSGSSKFFVSKTHFKLNYEIKPAKDAPPPPTPKPSKKAEKPKKHAKKSKKTPKQSAPVKKTKHRKGKGKQPSAN